MIYGCRNEDLPRQRLLLGLGLQYACLCHMALHHGDAILVLMNLKCYMSLVIGTDSEPADTQTSQCNWRSTRGVSAGGVSFSRGRTIGQHFGG